MEYRALGDLQVSLLGLGTSRLASLGVGRSRADVDRILGASAECGINFIDTSDTYGSTACERLLGTALAARRERFYVSTKGGLAALDLPGPLKAFNQIGKKALQAAGRRHVVDAVTISSRIEASLRRLQRDALDVYFLHAPPVEALNDEDLLSTLQGAVRSGKVRMLGVSSDDPAVVARAFDSAAFDVVQTSASTERPTGGTAVVLNQVFAGGAPAPGWDGVSRAKALQTCAADPSVSSILVGSMNQRHVRENAVALGPAAASSTEA